MTGFAYYDTVSGSIGEGRNIAGHDFSIGRFVWK